MQKPLDPETLPMEGREKGGNSIAKENGLKIRLKNGLKTRLRFLLTILSKMDLVSTAIPVLIQLGKKSA